MRLKITIVIFIFFSFSKSLFAQTVIIPDSGFKACLINKVPHLLDANQNLVIAKAQAYSSGLYCRGYEIKNLEGIQYFTNAIDFDFSRNKITELKAFPVNSKLIRLVLDDNFLTSLPELKNIPGLQTFVVRRNQLTSLPDLSANTEIRQFYVQSNKLTSIPDLRNQKKIFKINFSDNLLTTLPSLDSLKTLMEFIVTKNQLVQIPPMDKLAGLDSIDISSNQLSVIPVFPIENHILLLKLENNNFDTLPDFSAFPKLKKAVLDNNYLTFEDLQPLTLIPGYDTIFTLTSQKPLDVGQNFNIKEKDIFYIKTGVDIGIPGITRTWYYENKQVQQSQKDSLKVFSDSTYLSGNYYSTLTNGKFPNLTLRTTNFNIAISPCFTTGDFVINTTSGDCKINGGSIEITSSSNLPNGFSYQLKSTNGHEILTSSKGNFKNLASNEYSLYGFVGNCQKLIESSIKLEENDCENVYITVDGDGINDAYFFKETGKATIADKFGNTVSKITIPASWSGTGNQGLVAPGLYYANINNGERLIKITVVY